MSMKDKRKEKHEVTGWGDHSTEKYPTRFDSPEEARAYLRAHPPRPQDALIAFLFIAFLFAVFLSPVLIQGYQTHLVDIGDKAFAEKHYEDAEAGYEKALKAPLHDADKLNQKLCLTHIYEKKYEQATKELDGLILTHLAKLDQINSRRSSKVSVYTEAATLRYLVSNYGQLLALQGRANEVQPYQNRVWQLAFDSTKIDRKRHQMQKNILDTNQGSLRHRGYAAEADALSEKKMAIRAMPEEEQEAKNVELIKSLMPPQPYNNPVFSDDAMRKL